jgi:fatty acid desaturase
MPFARWAAMSASTVLTGKTLNDPALKAELQVLRVTDNFSNIWYIARTYLYLAAVIGGAIAFCEWQQRAGFSILWDVPVVLLAIVGVGAGQHQLSGLAHEGVHHILFRHRLLNDLASDLLTMFPLFSSTHHYRLQHLAHHQFVNDPDRDPDISQLKTSGHWFNFPVERKPLIRMFLRQLWPHRLVKFIRIRAAYNATGTDKNPYLFKGLKPSKVAVRIGLAYILACLAAVTGLYYLGDPLLLAAIPAAMWLAICFVYWKLPAEKFHTSRVHPVIPLRYMTMLRLGYVTLLFAGLAELTYWTGLFAGLYYFLFWVVPLLTSYSFFMILRQIVQHGNGDRGWLTNTRTFLLGPAIRFAAFPMGQGYHLPHHLYATIPHYRLRRLHEFLLTYPEYAEEAVVVEGYFRPANPKVHPTVLEVLGPEYAARHTKEIHVDNTVLEGDEFADQAAIEAEAKALVESGR